MTDRYGAEGSYVVVALHGSPANRKSWLGLSERLGPEAIVVAPDLPGHGSRRDEPFTVEASLRDVGALVAAERAEDRTRIVVVAGDSLGGYLALAAGAAGLGADAVVAGGCTFEMRGAASALAAASDLPIGVALRLAGASRLERIAAGLLRRLTDPAIAEAVVRAGIRFEARGESIRELGRLDVGALVAAVPVPIVFVNGSRDWPTRAHERRFARLARASELEIAPGSPHGVSQFAPAAFARAIERAVAAARRSRG